MAVAPAAVGFTTKSNGAPPKFTFQGTKWKCQKDLLYN